MITELWCLDIWRGTHKSPLAGQDHKACRPEVIVQRLHSLATPYYSSGNSNDGTPLHAYILQPLLSTPMETQQARHFLQLAACSTLYCPGIQGATRRRSCSTGELAGKLCLDHQSLESCKTGKLAVGDVLCQQVLFSHWPCPLVVLNLVAPCHR